MHKVGPARLIARKQIDPGKIPLKAKSSRLIDDAFQDKIARAGVSGDVGYNPA